MKANRRIKEYITYSEIFDNIKRREKSFTHGKTILFDNKLIGPLSY